MSEVNYIAQTLVLCGCRLSRRVATLNPHLTAGEQKVAFG